MRCHFAVSSLPRFWHAASCLALTARLAPSPARASRAIPLLIVFLLASPARAEQGVWRQRSFEDFSRGTFGNAGQNLYVSRAGVLQRIFRFDLNGDGFMD